MRIICSHQEIIIKTTHLSLIFVSYFFIHEGGASLSALEADTTHSFQTIRATPIKLPSKPDDGWIHKGVGAPQRLTQEKLDLLELTENKPSSSPSSLDADLQAFWTRPDRVSKRTDAEHEADQRRELWNTRFATEEALSQKRLPYPYALQRHFYSGKEVHERQEGPHLPRRAPEPILFTTTKELRLEAQEREKRITHLFNAGIFTRYEDPVFCARPRKTIPLLPREEVVATVKNLLRVARQKERPIPPPLPPLRQKRSLQTVFATQSLQNTLTEKEAVIRSQQVFSKPQTRAQRSYAVGYALEGVQLGITAWHLMEGKSNEAAAYLREAKENPLLSPHQKIALLDKADILLKDLLFFEDVDLGPFLCSVHPWPQDENLPKWYRPDIVTALFKNAFQAPDACAGYARFYLLAKKAYDQKEDFFATLDTKENPVNPERLPVLTVCQMLREVQTCANLQANTFVNREEDYFTRLKTEIITSSWQAEKLRRRLAQRSERPLVSFTLTDPTPLPLDEWLFLQKTKETWDKRAVF